MLLELRYYSMAYLAILSEYGGSYDSHVRNPVYELLKSYAEAIEVGRKAQIPVKLAHVKLVGLISKGVFSEIQQLVNAARNDGVKVASDQYPYDGAYNLWLWETIALQPDLAPKDEKQLNRDWLVTLLKNPIKRK